MDKGFIFLTEESWRVVAYVVKVTCKNDDVYIKKVEVRWWKNERNEEECCSCCLPENLVENWSFHLDQNLEHWRGRCYAMQQVFVTAPER